MKKFLTIFKNSVMNAVTMKTSSLPRCVVALLSCAGLAGLPISASAQIYMDMNGATAGFGSIGGNTPAGAIWNTTNTNWTTSAAGDIPTVEWNNTSGTTTFSASSNVSIFLGGNFTVSGLTVTGGASNFSFRSDGGSSANTNTTITVTGGEINVPTGSQITLPGGGTPTVATTILGSYTKTGGGNIQYAANTQLLGAITNLTIQEGTVTLRGGNANSSTNVTLSGGNFVAGQDTNYTVRNIAGTSGSFQWVSSGTDRSFTINQDTDLAFGGVIEAQAGGGLRSVVKNGAATLTLTGANTYNGNMTISAGTLQVGNGGTTGSLSNTNTINNAALIFNRSNDSSYAQIISGNGTVTKLGAGVKTLSGNNTFTGSTTVNGGTLLISGTGAINGTSGITVNTGGTLNYSSSTGLNRNITLNTGGTFVHSGSNDYTGTLTWNGGTLAGTNFSGVSLAVGANKTLSPGNSPGTMTSGNQTWTNGGNYNLQIFDVDLAAGSGFDTIAITGTLNLTGLTAGGFNINLWSLSSIGPDVNGDALSFDNLAAGSWQILSTTGGITGFDAANFTINVGAINGTAGFSNALAGGTFSVAQIGNNLVLEFTPIPEPSTWALITVGLCAMTLLRRRRS